MEDDKKIEFAKSYSFPNIKPDKNIFAFVLCRPPKNLLGLDINERYIDIVAAAWKVEANEWRYKDPEFKDYEVVSFIPIDFEATFFQGFGMSHSEYLVAPLKESYEEIICKNKED